MTRIDAELRVSLKGVDLAASTAELALVDKMGYEGRLLGLRRFDFFRFRIDSPAAPESTARHLQRILDRQSTFYNRNKHLYVLECQWDGKQARAGVDPEDLRGKWLADIRRSIHCVSPTNFDGKESGKDVIVKHLGGFLVEVLVEDDDPSARASVAAKIGGGLAAVGETAGVEVTCMNRATIWWLAIYAPDAEAATRTAQEIAVTTRRGSGLLMNPNYQRAEFVSVQPIASEAR